MSTRSQLVKDIYTSMAALGAAFVLGILLFYALDLKSFDLKNLSAQRFLAYAMHPKGERNVFSADLSQSYFYGNAIDLMIIYILSWAFLSKANRRSKLET